MFDFLKTNDNGLYVKLSRDVSIYKNNDSIIRKFVITQDENLFYINDIHLPTQADSKRIGPFSTEASARKALSRLSKNQNLRINPYIGLCGIILLSLGVGSIFSSRPAVQVPSIPPGAIGQMYSDPDVPTGINALTAHKPSLEDHPQTKVETSSPTVNGSEVNNKLKEILLNVRAKKPITDDMLKGLPDVLANKIKLLAQNDGLYQMNINQAKQDAVDSGGSLLGASSVKSNKTPESVKPSLPGDTDLVQIPATPQKPSSEGEPSINNQNIKDLEQKRDLLKQSDTMKPTSSDYKAYTDMQKDYPDLSNKHDNPIAPPQK